MRIALVHLGIDGAGPLYAVEMASALIRAGHNVLMIVSQYVENLPRWKNVESQYSEANLLTIDTYTSKYNLINKTLKIKPFIQIKKALRKHHSNILYSPMSDLWQPLIFKFCAPRGIIKVKTIHDMLPHPGENGILMRIYHQSVFHNTDKVVILSSSFTPLLLQKGFKKKDIIIIPHACFSYYNPNYLNKQTESHTIKYNILFFGRIMEYKGLDVILKAMQLVVSAFPTMHLTIAGKGDMTPYSELISDLKDHLEIKNRKIKDSEVAEFFEMCDCVVLPYKEASQSGVIPTAFSFAKPVIASRLGGIPEQVASGGGVLVDPNDIHALANAIIRLYKDPERLTELSREAAYVARNEMSWEASATKLVQGIEA